MDTREKIIPLNEAAQRLCTSDWIVVPGLFDPLTATQAKRLAALRAGGREIAAVVLEDDKSLLPADARAVLIAGLRVVSLVLIARSGEWRAAIPESARVQVTEDPEGEAVRSAEFVQFVLRRQNAREGGARP